MPRGFDYLIYLFSSLPSLGSPLTIPRFLTAGISSTIASTSTDTGASAPSVETAAVSFLSLPYRTFKNMGVNIDEAQIKSTVINIKS